MHVVLQSRTFTAQSNPSPIIMLVNRLSTIASLPNLLRLLYAAKNIGYMQGEPLSLWPFWRHPARSTQWWEKTKIYSSGISAKLAGSRHKYPRYIHTSSPKHCHTSTTVHLV